MTPPREGSAAFMAPLLVLACGHMLSNLVRTLPAIAADVLSADLGVSAEGLASLTGAYHFAFAAGQIPLGVALDRYGVRPVALVLLATITLGAVLAALVGGAPGFLLAQIVLGLGCCGMLLCPMTLAAKLLTPAKFGLWSGLIQGVGNVGMLLSASPLAWLVERQGWRAGFWAAAALGLVVALLVARLVPAPAPNPGPHPTLVQDARLVLRMGLGRRLRGMVLLAFASFAVVIGVRGLWGGPWLMEVKGLPRIEAGNVLLVCTLALIAGPALAGVLDRRLGQRRALLALGHALAGLLLLLLAAGGPGGWLAGLLGFAMLPPSGDALLLFGFGLSISIQPLIFAMTRAAVPPDEAGKALSAVNLSFFLGAAVLQAASGPVGASHGPGAAIAFLGVCVLACTVLFLATTRRAEAH
ncbi:MFS transporter [Pseudoroseomonas cervicalis]|uniref:MFS transporter n=1 Tax=Teichococcus cervicalis TaxID=204525 RepID=UPI002782E376|nr:MFS transporter [Pseudoroseomonas cervicalis]MDQ1081720.1 putative MFS family arabinose efflux permease [Pseudoroseomonas cervicalis]